MSFSLLKVAPSFTLGVEWAPSPSPARAPRYPPLVPDRLQPSGPRSPGSSPSRAGPWLPPLSPCCRDGFTDILAQRRPLREAPSPLQSGGGSAPPASATAARPVTGFCFQHTLSHSAVRSDFAHLFIYCLSLPNRNRRLYSVSRGAPPPAPPTPGPAPHCPTHTAQKCVNVGNRPPAFLSIAV